MVQLVAVAHQIARQLRHQQGGVLERGEVGDLAANMHVDAGNQNARQTRGIGIDLPGAGNGDAELGL